LKRVRFTGVRRRGTLYPRRVWRPDEVVEVSDLAAAGLVSHPDFTIVDSKTRRKLREE